MNKLRLADIVLYWKQDIMQTKDKSDKRYFNEIPQKKDIKKRKQNIHSVECNCQKKQFLRYYQQNDALNKGHKAYNQRHAAEEIMQSVGYKICHFLFYSGFFIYPQ